MAKKAAGGEGEAGNNDVNKSVVEAGIKSFEEIEAQITEIRFNAMSRIAKLRDKQGDVVEDVSERGKVTKKAFKAHLKERALAAKIERVREDLAEEHQDSLDNLKQKLGLLGDTPLGEAAMRTAGSKVVDIGTGKKGKGKGGFRPASVGDDFLADQKAKLEGGEQPPAGNA